MNTAQGTGLRVAHSLESSASDRLIVALDFTALAPAVAVARRLQGLVRVVKVGSTLFTACGPVAIQRLRLLGFEVMLDLKFLDIPSTVELSCRSAAHHRVAMLTVHASGGRAMLESAVRGVRSAALRTPSRAKSRDGARDEASTLRTARPKVLAVTILTSDGGVRSSSMQRQVTALAREALKAGCDGVVASAREAGGLRRAFGRQPIIVCPGIRFAQPPSGGTRRGARDDQRRICAPADALALGASALVVGRPITAARRPRDAAQQMLREMEGTTAC